MNLKLILITVIFSFLSAVSSWANSTAAIKEPITSIVVKKSDRKKNISSDIRKTSTKKSVLGKISSHSVIRHNR